MRIRRLAWTIMSALALGGSAGAFCGFFVARGDAKLYNTASQVIIASEGRRHVFTMMNNFQGNVGDFARIVPIPVVPTKEQVRIGDQTAVQTLDAFSAPRLVEYFDEDPCRPPVMPTAPSGTLETGAPRDQDRAAGLGVKIEAQYSVGEYDVVILSAAQSNGLVKYLRSTGYNVPKNAESVLADYIKSGMKFFVVKVNLERFQKTGAEYLRPIVIEYESDELMLPIRLGMLNSTGEQDLLLYILSSRGRVETSNYRTVNVPSNEEVPLLTKDRFEPFYRAMFRRSWEREGRNVAFLEYAWNTSWCDPCAADPPSREALERAGVFWPENKPVFLTRLHVRYRSQEFREDLRFRETDNQNTFQGRYVMRHAYKGDLAKCEAGRSYERSLVQRDEEQAQNLARLTGWDVNHIRNRMRELGNR